MMIETVVVTLAVLAAGAWVLRNMYRTIAAAVSGRASSCGSCGSCAKSSSNAKTNIKNQSVSVVSIGNKVPHRS